MRENQTQDPMPAFHEAPPEPQSFRSVFKWGDPAFFKHPSPGFLRVIRNGLGLTPDQFKGPESIGDQTVPVQSNPVCRIAPEDVDAFTKMVGAENVSSAVYDRLFHSSGKAMEDIFRLRKGEIRDICDLIIHPRNREDVVAVVAHCHERDIPIHVHGGGSSVTFGLSCPKGGVTLVMGTHMKRVISFNEKDQTITVEPGMTGPAFEHLLNNAPELLGAEQAYTGGHFPQSFEHSSVGGWGITLGSGQASSYYGDAADLVIGQEYVTPAGEFTTAPWPAAADGPRINEIMKGNEGCFGVLTAVTVKIFAYTPETAKPFSFMFPSFASAVEACRQISQGRFGMPAILRVSDPEETDVALQMYGLDKGILEKLLRFKGMESGRRCLVMGQAEGEKGFASHVAAQVRKICRKNQGMYLTGYPMKKWYKGRFSDPYMRDSLNDYGVLIDTLETSVTWESLPRVYAQVRKHIKARPDTICMTHASHFYAQGTNLYFIFILKMPDLEAFRSFQQGIIDCIEKAGGSLSHHHGVGRMMAPWMEEHLGPVQMGILRAVKGYLDPKGILNPGGLDL